MRSPCARGCGAAPLLWLLCLWPQDSAQNSAPGAAALVIQAAEPTGDLPTVLAARPWRGPRAPRPTGPPRVPPRIARQILESRVKEGRLPLVTEVGQVPPPRMPLPARAEHAWTAAVYLQVGNKAFWSELAECAQNVASSTALQHVDLFVSSFQALPEFEERLNQTNRFRQVYFQLVENMGADVGQFLQQLEATPNMTKQRGMDTDYDLILKMHTKTDTNWRQSAWDDLCGSVEQVDTIVRLFQSREGLGMLGPEGLVFKALGYLGLVFTGQQQEELAALGQVWELMVGEPLPEDKALWVMNAGSFFWARGGFFFNDTKFQAAVPKLTTLMPRGGYTTGSCCQTPHGFERALPTWMTWRGYSVLPVRNHIHQELISTE